MTLARLEITNFRCLARAELEIDPRLTVIAGPNASGKTSLLEAIFFLSCGRSFRTHNVAPLVRTGESDAYVLGRVDLDGRRVLLAVRGGRTGLETRISGEPVRGFAEHARLLPVQTIDPEIHKVLEEGPARRRRYLDWGVFHVEHHYVGVWRRYQRALKQRNAALKQGAARPAMQVWEHELIEAAQALVASRQRYLETLNPIAKSLVSDLLGLELELGHRPGWPQERTFAEALDEARLRDAQSGTTSVGPHRGDVSVRIGGFAAKDRVSRGQQKLLAAALVLAQVEHRAQFGGERPTLLIDDPAAELDAAHLGTFLRRVAASPAQLIVTALDATAVGALEPARMFHVEQGKLQQVV
ncbi:MAG TPA: DNA replication/repair protein RecF [Steroidobacteraceae bacterium]|nr:DNA replication/repair protein RecF [Steroidobacteraceae bacterium]